MTVRIRLNPDQERLYKLLRENREYLQSMLPGMSADEVMQSLMELGMAFCGLLNRPVDERAKLEESLRADPNLKGLINFVHWLWVRGETPRNETAIPRN
jgi:hypothetical protein